MSLQNTGFLLPRYSESPNARLTRRPRQSENARLFGFPRTQPFRKTALDNLVFSMIYPLPPSSFRLSKPRFSVARFGLLLPLCAATVCGGGLLTPVAHAQTAARSSGDYRLSLGDSLLISVTNHPDVDSEVVVRPDGKITVPRAGEVVAAGKTAKNLAAEIERLLARTLNNARVRVIVKEAAVQQMSVSGAVKTPGPYPYRAGLRVMDLIGRAGGLTTKASRIKGRVIRQGKEIPFDVSKADTDPASSANVPLRADDIVFLDAQDYSKQLTVTGNVNKPGSYDLDEGLTVAGLLAQAGGIKTDTALSKAYILRDNQTIPLDLRGFESGRVNPNSPLATFRFKRGDVLTVPENRNRIDVTGEVKNPSFYSLPEDPSEATVLRSLALAGGPQEDADLSKVTVKRLVNGQLQIIPIDVAAIQRGEATDKTILLPDDKVFVPKRDKNVTIGGAVARPGSYPMDDKETLISALAKAGDPTKDASLRKVSIFRDGKQIPIDLRPVFVEGAFDPEVAGFRLQSGDIIRVPDISSAVTVSGAVTKPGVYDLTDDLTVVALLAQAGNGTEEAALSRAYVARQGAKIPLDLTVFLSGTTDRPSLTGFRLKPGDTLVVPENKVYYAVVGQVSKPGKFAFPERAADATVLRALINADGQLSGRGEGNADLKNSGILREVDGKITVIPVDVKSLFDNKKRKGADQNFALQPYDVLYIPAKGRGFQLSDALGAASVFSLFR